MSKLHKYILLVLVLNFTATSLIAQVSNESMPGRAMNGIYWNAGGGATYISIEYERLIGRSKLFFLSAGAGLGTALSDDETNYATLPFHLSGNLGKGTSFFEFGLGSTLIFDHPGRDAVTYVIMGYRLSLPRKHRFSFSFRLNLDVPFDYINVVGKGDPMFIPAGLGLGITF